MLRCPAKVLETAKQRAPVAAACIPYAAPKGSQPPQGTGNGQLCNAARCSQQVQECECFEHQFM